MMYVPGNDWKKIQKIPSMKADNFIIDCEDGVALNRKVNPFTDCPAIFWLLIFVVLCRKKPDKTSTE